MKEKVLIIAHMSFSGMGPYVSEIVNTLSPDDNVYFIFFDMEDDYFRKNVKPELHVKSEFIRFHHGFISKADFLFGYYSARYRKKLLSYCKRNGITLVHFINGCTDTKAIEKLKQIGVKSLITVHDLHPHESNKAFYKVWKYRVLAMQEKRNFMACQNLVTNSRIQLEELKAMFPSKNIFFHEFPSLVSKEIAEGEEIPVELKGKHMKYILFFGRIEEYKGIDLLYKAYHSSTDINKQYALVIAGKGSLPPTVRKQEQENLILINRYVKDTEVAYLYRNAALVVYPYISATQSGVLSLAFYFNIPTLVSDIPYFASLVGDTGTAFLFKTKDKEDLSKQLNNLLGQNQELMKQCQRDYYEKYYSNKSIRNSLLTIYANTK